MKEINEKGVSLIEMLTVLFIIGILLGMGVFSMQKYQRGRSLERAVNQVSSDLQWAQSRAMNTGAIHKVTFYETEKRYEILNKETNSKVERSLPNYVTLTSTLDSLLFLPKGKVEEATVTLSTSQASSEIILNSLGETRIIH